MKYDYILGIDVGKSGGIALVDIKRRVVINVHKTPINDDGDCDIQKHLELFADYQDLKILAVVEKVTGRYGDAAHSAFQFGHVAGVMHTALTACQIPFELLHPKTWTKELGLAKDKANGETETMWKNRLKTLAKKLFPDTTPTLWNADALLIAEVGIRKFA